MRKDFGSQRSVSECAGPAALAPALADAPVAATLSSRLNFRLPCAALLLLSLAVSLCCFAADPPAAEVPSATRDETNSLEFLRSYVQLQEQVHATQLAIEETRKEAREAAARSAQVIAGRLDAIEGALASQRTHELETVQSSNRVMLIMAGTFATVGFIAMLLMAFFQYRTVNGLAEISTALPAVRRGLPAPSGYMTLPEVEEPSGTVVAQQASAQLLGSLEALQERIGHLERATRPVLSAPPATQGSAALSGGNGETPSDNKDRSGTASSSGGGEVGLLLAKGEQLLEQDSPEEALAAFEQALVVSPRHAEALVKKGTALERLRRFDQAIECYNQAIAWDSSLTSAYLHKGGLFNRLERFTEALECYEKALQTQQGRVS